MTLHCDHDTTGQRRSLTTRLATVLLVAASALLAACAAKPQIRSDVDPSADFSRYRTYAFVTPAGTDNPGYASIVTDRLKAAATAQMQARGYTYADKSPDLLVNFVAEVQQRQQTIARPPPPSLGWGYRRGYGAWGTYNLGWTNEIWLYNQAVLSVDLVDAARKQMIWQGNSAIIVESADEVYSPEALSARVNDVFSRYPYRAGSSAPGPIPLPTPAK